jgi:hypothetical protein
MEAAVREPTKPRAMAPKKEEAAQEKQKERVSINNGATKRIVLNPIWNRKVKKYPLRCVTAPQPGAVD